MAPSHYLNQCWNIVDWTLSNKLKWNLNRNFHSRRLFCLGLNVLTKHHEMYVCFDYGGVNIWNMRILIFSSIWMLFAALFGLIHYSWAKMAFIFQTTYSNTLSWTKIIMFLFKFLWNVFPRFQSTICHHWFKFRLGITLFTSQYLNQWWTKITDAYMHHLASICWNKNTCLHVTIVGLLNIFSLRLIMIYLN